MLDTVKLFHPHEFNSNPIPDNYKIINYDVSNDHYLRSGKNFKFYDPATGFNAYGENRYLRYFSSSLPRLLHGDNGRLIKNQSETDAAMDLLRQKAAELGDPQHCDSHFTRVDLVQQFNVDIGAFIRAHRECRHPRIRNATIHYGARSLVFGGSEMRISFYDKLREKCGRDGNILRVEIQLRGRRLMEELGSNQRVETLNFDACYQAYRRIMLGFQPPALPKVSRIVELLALGEREGWSAGGSSPFEIYTASMSSGGIRRLKREMAAIRPTVQQIDWSALLPADGPPPPVEI